MLAFIHLVACGEALALSAQAGLDLGQAWEVIAASSGTSFVHETEGQLILNGSYDIGFTMDLALKDLGLALQLGEETGVPLELASLTNDTFERASATVRRLCLVTDGRAVGRGSDRARAARSGLSRAPLTVTTRVVLRLPACGARRTR